MITERPQLIMRSDNVEGCKHLKADLGITSVRRSFDEHHIAIRNSMYGQHICALTT